MALSEYQKSRAEHIAKGRPLPEKKKHVINKVSAKRQAKIDEQNAIRKETGNTETELQKWYAEIMAKETPRCWETGEWINVKDTFGWHGSVAHVLPKELFPSVKTHPQNYMILKMWGGTHGDYDASWEKAAKMKVWPYACKVFNILYPLLTTEEKAKLPDIVLQEIKPEIYNAKLEPTISKEKTKTIWEDLEEDDGNWIHDIDMGAR